MESKVCTRCGCDTPCLYPYEIENDFREKVKMGLCWDCDFDVMNGGDAFEDWMEISTRRKEEDYFFDPINNPKPLTIK